MQTKSKGSWGTFFRIGVTIGILGFFASTLDWEELGKQFTGIDARWLAAAIGVFGAVMGLISLRWWTLLKVQEVQLPVKTATALTLIGQFFNTFLPGSVGGDVVKIFYILKYAPQRKARAALSIVMDRFVGICVLLTLAVATLPWQIKYFSHYPELRAVMWTLSGFFGIVVFGILFLAFIPFRRFPKKLKNLWKKLPKHEVVETLVDGFRHHGRAPKLTFQVIGYCVLVHLCGFLMGWCLTRALHLDVGFFQIMIVLAVVYILMSLPVSISGHGMREFGAVLMFSAYGVITVDSITSIGQEPAIAFSLLLFAVNLFWGLVGGIIYLTFRHNEKVVTSHL
ncbi:MAG: lysylphosphatidylglycerol synthase transmembrane domain-containing protein [Verrucomicrobiota bacterium]